MLLAKCQPRFSSSDLPHLDSATQKLGPDSPQAIAALGELDGVSGQLSDGYAASGVRDCTWPAASEYVMAPVSQVAYPNRLLRETSLLSFREEEGRELLDEENSPAWALFDHQVAHVIVRNPADIEPVAAAFRGAEGVDRLLVGEERQSVGLNHRRAGEFILIARPEVWFAYDWWTDDAKAAGFAQTVDIHRKPGSDPVEMFPVRCTRSTLPDATRIKGLQGRIGEANAGVFVCSDPELLAGCSSGYRDPDIASAVMRSFRFPAKRSAIIPSPELPGLAAAGEIFVAMTLLEPACGEECPAVTDITCCLAG